MYTYVGHVSHVCAEGLRSGGKSPFTLPSELRRPHRDCTGKRSADRNDRVTRLACRTRLTQQEIARGGNSQCALSGHTGPMKRSHGALRCVTHCRSRTVLNAYKNSKKKKEKISSSKFLLNLLIYHYRDYKYTFIF